MTLRQQSTTISTYVNGSTAESQKRKTPAPVQEAVVKSVPHSCIIEWKDNLIDENITFYKVCCAFFQKNKINIGVIFQRHLFLQIKSFSDNTSEEVELDVLSFERLINKGIDDTILFYSVNLNKHGLNKEIRFTVKKVSFL